MTLASDLDELLEFSRSCVCSFCYMFLFFLPLLSPGPVAAAPTSLEVVQPQEVRPLPGQLNKVPVFNSNSPEVIQSEGILLSTFPAKGKADAEAHLNFPLGGRFDLFAHHVARPKSSKDEFYLGVLLNNPTSRPVKVLVLEANSYLSRSNEAPFIDLPSVVESPFGNVYAGPGSRVASDALRRHRQADWPVKLLIPPGESRMLINLPIPNASGRSTLMRLWTNGQLYIASMAMQRQNSKGKQAPTLPAWQALLKKGDLVKPRDLAPTPLDQTSGKFIYGRVAGVSQGSQWQSTMTDDSKVKQLTIPPAGKAYAYVINSLKHGTLGTDQIQTAPMLARYADTAYSAHGNYGVQYSLTLPLYNASKRPQKVTLALQTPIKENKLSQGGLRFLKKPKAQVFFRGAVRLRYQDDQGKVQIRYLHLVQNRGQQGKPLLSLVLPPGGRRSVTVDLLYPPDSTPPQVLTVETLESLDRAFQTR